MNQLNDQSSFQANIIFDTLIHINLRRQNFGYNNSKEIQDSIENLIQIYIRYVYI